MQEPRRNAGFLSEAREGVTRELEMQSWLCLRFPRIGFVHRLCPFPLCPITPSLPGHRRHGVGRHISLGTFLVSRHADEALGAARSHPQSPVPVSILGHFRVVRCPELACHVAPLTTWKVIGNSGLSDRALADTNGCSPKQQVSTCAPMFGAADSAESNRMGSTLPPP